MNSFKETFSQNVAGVQTRKTNNTTKTFRLVFVRHVDIHQLVQLLVSPLHQSETELYSHPSQNQR